MRNFQKAIAVLALSGMCLAAPAPSDSDVAAKKAKKHAPKTEAAAPACAACADIKQLKDQVAAQQAEIDQLKNKPATAVPDAAAAAAAAAAQQQAAAAAAAAADANAKAAAAQGDVAGLKSEVNATSQEVAVEKKKVDYLEHPASIAYKGIRITPGGFIELTGYYRTHATLSDQATPFNAIPLGQQVNGGYNGNLSEFGMTARDSRITLRGDADAGATKLAAYYEMDFFGTGPTSNPNQTTSYSPRIRQAWGRAKFANGWTISGGQMWNLITLNRKGTDSDNSNLWIPNIIEAQYSIGYDWGRFAELRISKTLGKNTTFALGIANPSYLNSGANSAVEGLAANGNGLLANSLASTCTTTLGVTTCTNTPQYSTNLAPDMIVKLAYDNSKIGHYEVKALGRFFRDRVAPTDIKAGFTNDDLGFGFGAGAIVPVVSKKVDFIAQGLWGKGIARYEDAGASSPDFVVRATDHDLQAAKSFSALAGIETHPTKKTELDTIFGDEYYYRSTYADGAETLGFGTPTATNTGCAYETFGQYKGANPTTTLTALPSCTGSNRNLWNAKVIGYYDIYRGPFGTMRYGFEADYIERNTWSGNGGLPAGSRGISPKGDDKVGFLTMRYIFP
jgi:hypothetical protein